MNDPGKTWVHGPLRTGVVLTVLTGTALTGMILSGTSLAKSKGTAGVIATDHPLATQAGASVLSVGGNAVDATVAAALVLGVVQPAGSGLGGGGFAVVTQNGHAESFDFRENAPLKATREMFMGGASSTKGGLAVAVPSEAFGLVALQEKYGVLDWAAVVMPALTLASEGFEQGEHLKKSLLNMPEMSVLFGENNRRPALARALRSLATSHGEIFRTGWVAQDIVAAVQAAGGILTVEDFAAYSLVFGTPLTGTYGAGGKTYRVLTMPNPSSGGIALLELLGATEGVTGVRCEVEAAKHAMARRALTGGASTDTTIDPARVAMMRADCAEKTWPSEHYGTLVAPPREAGTAHISAMDATGLAIGLTTTINTSFGSGVVAPKSGILLNNEMDDFTTRPGQPNAFGLVQSAANEIAPGKRPLSSMTPTILLDEAGVPVLVAGASGGPFIITSTYQAIRNILDYNLDPQAAVSVPRWHHQWMPDQVFVEPGYPDRATLEAAGHTIKEAPGFSSAQVVVWRGGSFSGGTDPRKLPLAAGEVVSTGVVVTP